jgi:ATP-dependent helicase/nuclease subunit B
VLSPYRARAARVRALFCAALQDGEFPSAAPRDPLLSEERRRQIGNRDLRRSEPAEEERYLFHSCVSRPTERLYLSWQSSDENGAALARSAFVDEVLDLLRPDPQAEPPLLRERGPEHSVPRVGEATSDRALARALALGGRGSDRESELARLRVPRERADAVLALFAELPDPDSLPGPLAENAVTAQLAGREAVSANSLEGWLECPYRWFVAHELSPQRLEPEADPLWLGSVVHGALERLYREPPGTDSIPRPADVGRWRARFAELLEAVTTDRARAPLNRTRRAALDRARVQVEAFLESEASAETDFRPARELLELGFGPLDDVEPTHPPLALGPVLLRGRIDRIDLSPDGGAAIVRDYKTAKAVPRAKRFADEGTLQIQLYLLVAKEVLGLEPIAGLYQPLGAASAEKRRPRGIALDDERTDGLGLVGTDRLEAGEFEEALAGARSRALEATGQMREGGIARRPIGGRCPKYCTFQAICRLERAVGAIGDQDGGENGGAEK